MEPLNDLEKDSKNTEINTLSKKIKIIFGLLILIIVILIVVIIIVAATKKTEIVEKIIEKESEQKTEELINWKLYGTILYNLSYSQNGKIINSFKETGPNYNKSMGIINEGRDYDENERNIYDLYIPYYATKRNNEYNGIILFIHGGSWIGGEKEGMDEFCKMYAQMGYITATMGYTLLNGKYKDYNIFRILDEITSCIENIKKELIDRGFKEDKLQIAIAGYSAGAHLTLLYTYLMKNSPIEIKFALNLCGPVSLEPKYFYKLAKENDTLDDLYLPEIEKALETNRIIRIEDNDSTLLWFMNIFIGSKYTQEQLNEMLLENKKINVNSEKYKELFNVVTNAFPSNIDDINKIPTICLYGGNDNVVGVTQFAYIYEKAKNDGKIMSYIYSRYAGHMFLDFETDNGVNAMREMNYRIVNFSKTYFDCD